MAVVLAFVGCGLAGGGRPVSDPSGRFSFAVGDELRPKEEQEGFYHYRIEKSGIEVFVVAEQASLEEQGVEEALRKSGVDPSALVTDGTTSFGDWQASRSHVSGGSLNVAVAWQMRGPTVYALAVTGGRDAMPADPPGPVMRLLGSIRFTQAAGRLSVPSTMEELETSLDRAAQARGGSISIAAIRNGRIVYRYATGASRIDSPASPAVAYRWGSMTKPVTAVAVMQLVEKRQLDLDAPVARYLPEFPSLGGITARDLLTHSSGLPDREVRHLVSWEKEALPSLSELLKDYCSKLTVTDFPPGSDSSYSNWDYLVLGVLIERITGKPYSQYVAESVLAPLGMTRTAFRGVDLPPGTPLAMPVLPANGEAGFLEVMDGNTPRRDGRRMIAGRTPGHTWLVDVDIVAPWGGLTGPADDAARFLWMNLDTAPSPERRVLSQETIRSMRAVQRSTAGRPLGWTLGGWEPRKIGGEDVVEHAGGGPGIECLMRLYPKRGLGVVVMANMNDYGAPRIVSAAADIISGKTRSGTPFEPRP